VKKLKAKLIISTVLSFTMLFSLLAPSALASTEQLFDVDSDILCESFVSPFDRLEYEEFEKLDVSMLTFCPERARAAQARLTQTLNEPVGVIGFEGPYAVSNENEIIEIVVQFVTPPSAALSVLHDIYSPRSRSREADFDAQALAAHDAFAMQLGALPIPFSTAAAIEVFGRHHTLFNGVFMRIPAHMVYAIAALPEVFAVTPNITFHSLGVTEDGLPQTNPSDEFMRETLYHLQIGYIHELGITGGGQTHVAVLDTGIDYNHPVFHRYRILLPCGNYGFRGQDFIDFSRSPMEALPPNATSHGTHVAGTIAAIAPDITMSHWRVLGPNGAVGNSVMLGIEGAFKDGADVMNLSLGANVNLPFDPSAYALNIASLNGVVVVVAAGNSGYGPYTLGTPAVSSLPITVANAQMGGRGHMRVNDATANENPLPLTVRGWPFGFDANTALRDVLPYRMLGAAPTLANTPDLTGYVAVIQRGVITFVEMREIAQTRNASALIIVDSTADNLDILSTPIDGPRGETTIPILHTANAYASLFANATGIIDFGTGVEYTPLRDNLNVSSSRGPVALTYHISPDIAAPGTRIMSTVPSFVANIDDNPYCHRYAYQFASGTSMSAPAVAGVAALLIHQFPNAAPYEIKARLMNTARPLADGIYGVFDVGAGFMVPLAALQSQSFATVEHYIPWRGDSTPGFTPGLSNEIMSSLSFGSIRSNDESQAAQSQPLTVIIHNANGTWTPQVTFNGSHSGVTLQLVNYDITGANHTFTFKMMFSESASFGYYEGNIVFSNGENRITMPFAARYRDNDVPPAIEALPTAGIFRPIISGFTLEYEGQDDPRLQRSNIVGALTDANVSTSVFGWTEPTDEQLSRLVEFYAIQTYGSEVGRLFYGGYLYLRSPGGLFAFADLVASRMGGYDLPEGVYEMHVFIHDPVYGEYDRGLHISLGEFVVTNRRPVLIFDNDGYFTFGPNDLHVQFSGRVESWAQDIAIERDIRTVLFTEIDTDEPALFDYRFAYINMGAGFFPASADGTFLNPMLPHISSFDQPMTFYAAAADGVIPHQGIALAAMVSVLTPFTHEYVGPAEIPPVLPHHITVQINTPITEFTVTEGSPVLPSLPNFLAFWNLVLVDDTDVYGRSVANGLRLEWWHNGQLLQGIMSGNVSLFGMGVHPADPDRWTGTEMTVHTPSAFGHLVTPAIRGDYVVRAFLGDTLLAESETIRINVIETNFDPALVEVEPNWNFNRIEFMEGTVPLGAHFPKTINVTLPENTGLAPNAQMRTQWVRENENGTRTTLTQTTTTLQSHGIFPYDPNRLTNENPINAPIGGGWPMTVNLNAFHNGEWRLHVYIANQSVYVSEDVLTINIYRDLALEHLTVTFEYVTTEINMREWQHPLTLDDISPVIVHVDFGQVPDRTTFTENTLVAFNWQVGGTTTGLIFQRTLGQLGIDPTDPDRLVGSYRPPNGWFRDGAGNAQAARWTADIYNLQFTMGGGMGTLHNLGRSDTITFNVEPLISLGNITFSYVNFPEFTVSPPPFHLSVEFETELDRERLVFAWLTYNFSNGRTSAFTSPRMVTDLPDNMLNLNVGFALNRQMLQPIIWVYGLDEDGNVDMYNVIAAYTPSRWAFFMNGAQLCDCGVPHVPYFDCRCNDDLPVFDFEIFNNGPGGTQYPRPNASLAEAGLIRMWTRLDGVGTPICFTASYTITAYDQDNNCAMDFVRVGRVWTDGQGWTNYFNLLDIDKNGCWQYINLTITVFEQTVDILLVNDPPVNIYHTVTITVEAGAIGVYATVTTTVEVPNGETIPADVIPSTVPRIGFYFAGWYPSSPAEHGYVTENLAFTAKFNPLWHYITFEAGNGGILQPADGFGLVIRIRDGFTFWEDRVPAPVANEGYKFVEWYPANPAGFTVHDNMTFTAVFAAEEIIPVTPQIVSVTPNPAIVEQGGIVELVVITQGMPDGAWVDLNVTWRPGLYVVGGPRFYIVNNQAVITVSATADARLGRDGFAIAARAAGDWGIPFIIDSYTFVIEVK